MLVVVSPAKRLDWSEQSEVTPTDPAFRTDANKLVKTARTLAAEDLSRMMDISADLGRLNAQRFRDFKMRGAADVRPAMLAFAGDTYQGLDAQSLSEDARRWAQDHLRILSGLYGLLRPLDAIQPYRLEMGTRFATDKGKTLYDYWGNRIAKALNKAARETGAKVLLNCASQEYFGAVDRKALKLRVVAPVFLEDRDGAAKTVSFFAKRARGAMARYVVENRIEDPADLRGFDLGGYAWDAAASTEDAPVFKRPYPEETTKLAS